MESVEEDMATSRNEYNYEIESRALRRLNIYILRTSVSALRGTDQIA